MEGRGRWDWDPPPGTGRGSNGRKDGVGGTGKEGGGRGGEEISIHGFKLVAPPMGGPSLDAEF